MNEELKNATSRIVHDSPAIEHAFPVHPASLTSQSSFSLHCRALISSLADSTLRASSMLRRSMWEYWVLPRSPSRRMSRMSFESEHLNDNPAMCGSQTSFRKSAKSNWHSSLWHYFDIPCAEGRRWGMTCSHLQSRVRPGSNAEALQGVHVFRA